MSSQLLKAILETLQQGDIQQVCIGLHWTAVVVEVNGEPRCGLASTLSPVHEHTGEPDVPLAGGLRQVPGRQLAELSYSEKPVLASLGVAALNALLPRQPERWTEANAEDLLAHHGAGKNVVLVGHFPFVNRLKAKVGELRVLELDPQPGDLPSSAAPQVIPHAQVIGITGMTLQNHTLEGLLGLCRPEAFVMVIGPSAPLSPVLFGYGVNMISSAVVTEIDLALRVIAEGGNFRQLHKAGVRLFNMLAEA